MTKKEFKKQANIILKNYVANKDGSYNINTVFGNVYFRLEPNPRLKLYVLYMRFTELEKFSMNLFRDKISNFDLPSSYSRKWNVYSSDALYILDELDTRLSNFEYLNNN